MRGIHGVNKGSFPGAAEEELADTISLDEYLIHNRDATFLLRVKGNAMEEAGILEGDLLLVERGLTPTPGAIVVALVDGEYTMKYVRDLKKTAHVVIEAVVKAVIRKY